jgi:hypothetical protein
MKRLLRWTAALLAGVLLTACCVAPWGPGARHGGGGYHHGR